MFKTSKIDAMHDSLVKSLNYKSTYVFWYERYHLMTHASFAPRSFTVGIVACKSNSGATFPLAKYSTTPILINISHIAAK